MTVHKLLEDGRVRELYKATGGAWGGTKVDEAFSEYFCQLFAKEVIEKVKQEYPADWVEMMIDFEKVKHKISLNNQEEFVHLTLRPCLHEVYLEVMNVNMNNAFKNGSTETRGATLNRHKLQIPKSVISDMIKQVAESISSHAVSLLKKKEIKSLEFILMVGGFSNSPIVVQGVKDSTSLEVIVPENPELSVVQGAVMFGWKPEMFKSRKSRRTYGISCSRAFRENIDPVSSMYYDDNMVKRCNYVFDKLVGINEEVEVGHTVKRIQSVSYRDQIYATIKFYESEKSDVSYYDEPGVIKLGYFKVPMTDTTGGMNRKIEITVRFGGTEIIVNGKDLTTGVDAEAVYDFL